MVLRKGLSSKGRVKGLRLMEGLRLTGLVVKVKGLREG